MSESYYMQQFQEPFCPPRPPLPQVIVAQSQYEQDLHQLHEVRLLQDDHL